MSLPSSSRAVGAARAPVWSAVPGLMLAPVPLFVLQPLFSRIAAHMAETHPELFARLGPHVNKRFLIDPIDLPFVLLLVPDASRPCLDAYRRAQVPPHDAAIAGTFLDLFDLIDGACDGDALFFSRDLRVSGDTEAVVALRNALDDFEASAVDAIAQAFGPLSTAARLAVSALRAMRGRSHA